MELELNERGGLNIVGHIKIKDATTGQILVDQRNAIHPENFSIAAARSLGGRPEGLIHEMHFGNGAAITSGSGTITYFPKNTTGMNANLYNPTYFKVVNDLSPLNVNPQENFIQVRHLTNTFYSDIVVLCTLDLGEPAGQSAHDDDVTLTGDFTFNELGLKTFDTTPGNGLLISHVTFSPVQKSLNRLITVEYTIRITIV